MSAAENEVQQPSTTIAEYSPTVAALADLERRIGKTVYDVSTPKLMGIAKKDRAEVRGYRIALENMRVEIKAPALKRTREIDTEATRIRLELERLEAIPDAAIKAEEARKENERKAKVEAERVRVAAIQHDIEHDLRMAPSGMVGRSSVDIQTAIADLTKIEISIERYAEFTAVASSAKASSLSKLGEMLTRQIAHEAEQQRLADERAELERVRVANELAAKTQRERIAKEAEEAKRKADAEAAAAKAERERVAEEETAERARKQAQEDEARRQRQAVEDEDRRKREADQAIADQERKRKLDEELAAKRAENERIAEAHRVELERKRAEQEAKDKVEADRLAAERAEIDARRAHLEQEELRALEARLVAAAQEAPPAPTTPPHPDASIEAREYQPTAEDLIGLVSAEYGVSPDTAGRWLRDAFAPVEAA